MKTWTYVVIGVVLVVVLIIIAVFTRKKVLPIVEEESDNENDEKVENGSPLPKKVASQVHYQQDPRLAPPPAPSVAAGWKPHIAAYYEDKKVREARMREKQEERARRKLEKEVKKKKTEEEAKALKSRITNALTQPNADKRKAQPPSEEEEEEVVSDDETPPVTNVEPIASLYYAPSAEITPHVPTTLYEPRLPKPATAPQPIVKFARPPSPSPPRQSSSPIGSPDPKAGNVLQEYQKKLFQEHMSRITGQVTAPPPVSQTQAAAVEAVVATDPTFTVVSYNVRIDVDQFPHDWKTRSPDVVRNIKQLKPSILCLQESSNKVLIDLLRDEPSFMACGVKRSVRGDEAVHVLVDTRTWGIQNATTHVFRENGPLLCPGGACNADTVFGGKKDKYPRIFTHVRLIHKGTGTRVHVINTHFTLDPEMQGYFAQQLAMYVQTLGSDANVIVTGDLNAHYAPRERNTPLEVLLARGGLCDSFDLEDVPTFAVSMATAPDPNTHRLDYILYKGAPLVRVDVGVAEYRQPNGHRPSDHEAVFARFRLV